MDTGNADTEASEEAVSDLKYKEIKSVGDFCRAIYRQLSITKGYLIAIIFIFTTTFVFFPGVMDDTNIGFMVKDITDNETSWF